MSIQFSANSLDPSQVFGDQFALNRTHPSHYGDGELGAPQGQPSFGQMLFESLSSVNADQQNANNLSVQAVVNPDSINPHDVTIAMAKANMSLSITKNVVDRVVQAYKDITTLR
jgi:flagellar hook-basal body complex protein FliE